MKVFVVSDMEGVSGIVKWQQTDGVKEKQAYHEGRELYTEEINAAVRGAKAAGAKEIVVMDCHGAGEEWTPDGVLAHTVSGQSWRELKFNGTSVGETGINAALCGHWNCPVLLVTGDDAVCREAKELLGDGLTTVSVKKGLGAYSARQIPPLKARELIEDGAKKALKDLKAVTPYDPGRPSEIQIEFHTPARLVEYRNRKGTEQIDEHTLVSRADDWWTAWSQFYF